MSATAPASLAAAAAFAGLEVLISRLAGAGDAVFHDERRQPVHRAVLPLHIIERLEADRAAVRCELDGGIAALVSAAIFEMRVAGERLEHAVGGGAVGRNRGADELRRDRRFVGTAEVALEIGDVEGVAIAADDDR